MFKNSIVSITHLLRNPTSSTSTPLNSSRRLALLATGSAPICKPLNNSSTLCCHRMALLSTGPNQFIRTLAMWLQLLLAAGSDRCFNPLNNSSTLGCHRLAFHGMTLASLTTRTSGLPCFSAIRKKENTNNCKKKINDCKKKINDWKSNFKGWKSNFKNWNKNIWKCKKSARIPRKLSRSCRRGSKGNFDKKYHYDLIILIKI